MHTQLAAVVHLLDGDAAVIAALIGAHDELVVIVPILVLILIPSIQPFNTRKLKLPVGCVEIHIHRVGGALLDRCEVCKVAMVAHSHAQHLLRVIHNHRFLHRRHAGHGYSLSPTTNEAIDPIFDLNL